MSCPACSLFAHNELVDARTVRSNQIIRHVRCLNCSVFDGPYLVNNQDHLHDTLYSAAPHHCILIRSDMSDSKLSWLSLLISLSLLTNWSNENHPFTKWWATYICEITIFDAFNHIEYIFLSKSQIENPSDLIFEKNGNTPKILFCRFAYLI